MFYIWQPTEADVRYEERFIEVCKLSSLCCTRSVILTGWALTAPRSACLLPASCLLACCQLLRRWWGC